MDERISNLDPAARGGLADGLVNLDVILMLVTYDLPSRSGCVRAIVLSDKVVTPRRRFRDPWGDD